MTYTHHLMGNASKRWRITAQLIFSLGTRLLAGIRSITEDRQGVLRKTTSESNRKNAREDSFSSMNKKHEININRQLLGFYSNILFDPKTIEIKEYNYERPIQILALGGSVTWGATLPNRYDAYPWLLGKAFNSNLPTLGNAVDFKAYVDNKAMRATGADYPSICLESIVSPTKSYDIILFDFVMNGTNGFPLLIQRLRERYPKAILIYVHIWSLVHLARHPVTKQKPRSVGLDPTIDYIWSPDTFNPNLNEHDKRYCGREVCDGAIMEKLVKDVGGHVFKMPQPETPKQVIENGWFSPDWHHLSQKGHEMVANGLLEMLSSASLHNEVIQSKVLGSFGLGDHCYTWFLDGNVGVSYTGGKLLNLLSEETKNNPESAKWVIEAIPEEESMVLTYSSKFNISVPVGLSYMSMQERELYSLVDVSSSSQDGSGKTTVTRIDPNHNLNTLTVHITVYSNVGWAEPGINTLTIRTVEQRQLPFRAVGIFLCGHCAESNDFGTGAINRKPPVDDMKKT